MTSERNTGQAQDVTDERVSEAYRDLAGERAPASLNERVLREARAHAGSGYSWWMGWLRPAAWVATVGLCLAIVVELTNTPVTDIEHSDIPATLGPAAPDTARERSNEALVRDGRTSSDELRQQAPARKSEADDIAPNMPGLATPAESPQREQRVDVTPRAAASTAEPRAGADSSFYEVTDAPILEDAEEMARMREGPVQDPAGQSSLRAVAARADMTRTEDCDAEARSEAESWIECILDIERRGGNADDERDALLAAFPDAELP